MSKYRVDQAGPHTLRLTDEAAGRYLVIEAVQEDILRVRFSRQPVRELASDLVEDAARACCGELRLLSPDDGAWAQTPLRIQAGRLLLDIDQTAGTLAWFDPAVSDSDPLVITGPHLLTAQPVLRYTTGGEKPVIERRKTVDGERNFVMNLREEEVRSAYRGRLCLTLTQDEGIYGLGQAEEGFWNLRGHSQYLYQHNMRIPMPVLYSDRGYGLFVDCGSLMTWEDSERGTWLFCDTIDQLDYYLLPGPELSSVIRSLRKLTGQAVMLPRWAYGYIQSKEQYTSARELADVIKRYRDLGIPCDAVVQDWNSWRPGLWGEKQLDPARYGDIRERMDEIHGMHGHAMVSIWPNTSSRSAEYQQFAKEGYLLNDCSTYDAFNEEARAIYWKQAKEGLFDKGFDAWWCDSTEPFTGPDWNGEEMREPWERYQLVGGEAKKYLDPGRANLYARMHAQGIYEHQRTETTGKRVLNLTRSGYVGSQRYGAMLWSGDTTASWDTLRRQITEGLSMSVSGYPYWTLDIGGFFTVGEKWQNRGCGCSQDPTPKWFWKGAYDEGVKDAGYRELYVRWLEYGTFLPMFRSHGTDTPREIWQFGEPGSPAYDAIARFIRLRYRLMPYIYSLAGSVALDDACILRPLLSDFREDPQARGVHDAFLFGPGLLVCPVTEPMYYEPGSVPMERNEEDRIRHCYLPGDAHTVWVDAWTGETLHGGGMVVRPAPLDRIPVFLKSGSIIPMRPMGAQYAGDVPEGTPLILQVTPGADGSFVYYDDEGDGYGYEAGAFCRIPFTWEEETHTLFIGARQGVYPGMPREIPIIVHLTTAGGAFSTAGTAPQSPGDATGLGTAVTATYTGSRMEVRLDG
ncbi:MAG: DUF5110 domain-containing protein [Butyrivibrio sp.]|nr:DUF5110 domain-containing protein [Butyrivibrio sp.]